MGFLQNTASLYLDNGLRAFCLPRRSATVEIQLHIASGSIHEEGFLGCGLSHFLEHMAFQGAKGYPGNGIADTVNVLGGDVNAYTTYDRTCYRMQLPAASCRKGVEMLAAMVRFPELPAKRFEKERDVILRECDRGADNPDSRVHEEFMKQMFLTHPLRHPVIGYREMISTVTAEMAREYHQKRYTPSRCVAVAVGGVIPEEFFAFVQEYLGSWERGQLAEMCLPNEAPIAAVRSCGIVIPDEPAARLMCGVRVPGFGAEELPALELLMGVLGTGDGAVLSRKLVLEQNLALGIRSFCYSFGGHGIAGIAAKCEPEKTDEFFTAMQKELAQIAAGDISASDVEREKGQQYADRLRELREPVNVAGEIACGVMIAGTPEAGDAYLDKLAQCSVDDVKAVAARYLAPEKYVNVIQRNSPHISGGDKCSSEPEIYSSRRNCGATFIHVPDDTLPLCNFFMALPGGAICENTDQHGLTKLVAATLSSGSAGITETQILQKMDEAGMDLEISGGLNSLIIEFSAPKRSMDKAVALLAEVLHAPEFPDAAWEREKQRHISVLKERAASPVKKAFDAATGLLYGRHPYAGGGYGEGETFGALTPDDGRAFFQKMLYAPQCVWGFAGDCSGEDVAGWSDILESALPWVNEAPERSNEPVFSRERKFAEYSLNKDQTVVLRLLPGVSCSRDAGVADVCDILSQAENGLGSNLFKSVREKHALSYSVGMSYAAGFHPGYFAFYAMTAASAGKKVLKLLNDEVCRIAENGLKENEFNAARAGAVFESERVLDSPESLLRTAGMEAYYGFSPEELLSRPRRLKDLTAEVFNIRLKEIFSAAAGVELLVLGNEK